MASLGEAVVDVGANTAGFRKQVDEGVQSALASASKSVQNVGKGFTSAGRKLTLGVTTPLVGIGIAAVRTAGQFEQSMNSLSAATGISGSALEALQTQAKQLGADTVFSANEAADAMLELGKSGQNAAQITKTLPQVLNLAATEGLALSDSAGIVTSALAQFGLGAEDSAQVVNALAGASNASRSSVASLAESFKLVGSAGSSVGLSVQETAGALAALSQSGLDGSIAGTSLAAVLNRLVPTTKKAKDAMSGLNLDFTNADGSFKSIDNIAQQLQTTFKGMSEEQRKIQIGAIFGRDASTIAAVNALVSAGGKGLRTYTKAASDQSAAQKLAEARMKGVAGAIEKLKGSLETAALTIGQAMIPVITKVAGVVGTLADKFTGLSPHMQGIIVIAAGVAAAIGPILIVVGALITSIGAIAGVFAALSLAVVAPIAAVVALVAIFALFMAKSQAARDVVSDAFSQIKTAVLPAVSEISSMFTGTLIPAFQKMWPIIEKVGVIFLKVFASQVVNAVKGALNVIVGVFRIISGVVKVFTGIFTGDFGKAWEGIKQIFSGALLAIKGLLTVWFNVGILGFFRNGFVMLVGVITGAWGNIKAVFVAAFAALVALGVQLVSILTWPYRMAFAAIKAIVIAAWAGIKAIFSAAMGAIASFISTRWANIKANTAAAWNAIRSAVSGAINAVKSAVTTGFNNIMSTIRGFVSKIKGLAGDFLSAGKHIGSQVIKGLGSGLKAAGGFVTDLAGSIKGAINSALHLPFTIHGPGPLPDFNIPAFAGGTMSAPSGMALVGERGRELVSLGGGERIYPNHATERMLGSDDPVDLSDESIRKLAAAILAGARAVSAGAVAANNRHQEDAVFN